MPHHVGQAQFTKPTQRCRLGRESTMWKATLNYCGLSELFATEKLPSCPSIGEKKKKKKSSEDCCVFNPTFLCGLFPIIFCRGHCKPQPSGDCQFRGGTSSLSRLGTPAWTHCPLNPSPHSFSSTVLGQKKRCPPAQGQGRKNCPHAQGWGRKRDAHKHPLCSLAHLGTAVVAGGSWRDYFQLSFKARLCQEPPRTDKDQEIPPGAALGPATSCSLPRLQPLTCKAQELRCWPMSMRAGGGGARGSPVLCGLLTGTGSAPAQPGPLSCLSLPLLRGFPLL